MRLNIKKKQQCHFSRDHTGKFIIYKCHSLQGNTTKYLRKNSANCELYTSFFGQHLRERIYIYIKYTVACILNQQDGITIS